jgi:thioredoxin 1
MSKFNEIIKSDTPTLVDFHAIWCGPCKAMSPILDQLKHKKGLELRVLKLDIDKNQELAARFKIRSVPTIMLFSKGKTIWRHSGGMDLRTLIEKTKVKG